jgi:glycine/D-amino acid oxidase-like deaminating enzyme
MSSSFDVVSVGAGLAGLRAAQVLEQQGREVVVVEAAEHVGGRIASEVIDGFTIDAGFQLLNTSYPELRAAGLSKQLDLRVFPSTVALRKGGRDQILAHPLRDPRGVGPSLWGARHDLVDLSRFARVLAGVGLTPTPSFLDEPDVTTLAGLRRGGLSERFINETVRPFLEGVLLENELETSWRYTRLVLRSFVRGRAAVPSAGMQALPLALRRTLTSTQFRFGEHVQEVRSDGVTTNLGTLSAHHVLVATDQNSAARLLGRAPEPQRTVTTWWFSTPVLRDGRLHLDVDGAFLANAVAMSASAPEYAPRGRSLIAASAVGHHEDGDVPRVRTDVARLFGLATSDAELIATSRIAEALPVRSAGESWRGSDVVNGVTLAGDYLETPSIQGALVSGRRAARRILQA